MNSNFFKRILTNTYNIFVNILWRLRIKHHNTAKLSRYAFPFITNKVTYNLPSKGIKHLSNLNIYKLKNIYKPALFYAFYSPRFKYFISEDWIFDIKKQINFLKKNINIENNNLKKINLNKPIFFLISTPVYSYYIMWNIINVLLLKKNKVDFVLGMHEDLSKKKKFNKDFLFFFKKYLNCKIITLPSKKNILINSETILFENYSKVNVLDEKKYRLDYDFFPKEIFTDLPKIIINNKKLKKYFGKPRNDIVLISRKDSRVIANENELLKKIPVIKKIIPEELSIEEELSFAYHAKIIISTYGAALSNIFFARPNKTTLIRLTYDKISDEKKEDLFSNYTLFEMMADNLKINHITQKHGKFYGYSDEKNSHFYVDIKKLDSLINKTLN